MNNVLATQPTTVLGREAIMRFPKEETPGKVTPCSEVSAKDEAGIVRLYRALVPENISKDIDVGMIVKEAFPAFEETIGVSEFAKVKKYFGIGSDRKSKPREAEIYALLGKMRTIENATKYISGYKQLIENVAARLCEAPEDMTVLERAKLVRVYMVIFGDSHFFPEDFSVIQVGYNEPERMLLTEKVFENNKKPFNPEELIFMYNHKIKFFNEKSIMYGIIAGDLLGIEKKLRKEVMEIAELKINPDGTFFSENKALPNQTFGSVRKLKMKVIPTRGVYPIEIFCNKGLLKQWNFVELYKLYKLLNTSDWESFPKVESKEKEIVGSRVLEVTRKLYQVDEDMFSGYAEMERVQRYIHHLADMEYELIAQYLVDGKVEPATVNVGRFMAVAEFANYMEYISKDTPVVRDFEVIDSLLEKDNGNVWLELKRGEIDFEGAKNLLGIDKSFESEVLNIKKQENPEDVATRFVTENGYCEEVPNEELIKEVLISGNESLLQRYASGEFDTQTFKRKIGFNEDFAEMYFNLEKVDIPVIEEKLQEMKRSMSGKAQMRANALLINLYCYLVEKQIPCGAKRKAPKRNKGLKPQILKKLITV